MPKPNKTKPRNPYAPAAKKRRAGKHKPKSAKRSNGKNEQQELLKEIDR
jgi:hypothetical protein